MSTIAGGRVRVEFIKGYRDNPKINAMALFRGEDAADLVPQLLPLESDAVWDIGADEMSTTSSPSPAQSASASLKQKQQQHQQRVRQKQLQKEAEDALARSYSVDSADGGADTMGDFVGDEDEYTDDVRRPSAAQQTGGSSAARKTSGPRQEDPYALDDSSVMLPVFIAIGAFIPLLFCLCKL